MTFSKKSILLVLAVVPLAAAVIDYAAEGKAWWAHVQFLADDKLQGRNIGTEGYQKAVEYVTGQFQRLGLKAAGTQGYLQPVAFVTRQLVEDQSSLALVRDGAEEPLAPGTDASLSARAELAPPRRRPWCSWATD